MRDGGMNPRLLLVEDDPVSQTFLAEAARALPARVDCAGTLAEARALAAQHAYDAWLIDAHLPDGRGAELLALLREQAAAPPPFALAHTASRHMDDLQALLDAGFDRAIAKPTPAGEWQAAIRAGLRPEAASTWDDAQALRALNGNAASVQSLRGLFLQELPKQHGTILGALDRGEHGRARDELHRLKASCGFVGAAALRQAVEALHAAPEAPSAREAFVNTVADTLRSVPLPR